MVQPVRGTPPKESIGSGNLGPEATRGNVVACLRFLGRSGVRMGKGGKGG